MKIEEFKEEPPKPETRYVLHLMNPKTGEVKRVCLTRDGHLGGVED